MSSKVDERFELTSIAFRLADADEYVNNQLEEYMSHVDSYFAKNKKHALITYIKTLRETQYIGYDAVASSTSLLEVVNGKIRLSPYADISKYIESDSRWTEESLNKYVSLLNKFYKDTKFRNFYKQHAELYKQAEQNLNILLADVNTDWFESFYGEPFGSPEIYVGMCNGGSNYALLPYLKNKPQAYGIVIGCSRTDEYNVPVFESGSIIPIIVHEFSHAFSNPIVEKYIPEMMATADTILPYVYKQQRSAGYGTTESLLYESFNSLFTNMYFKENPTGYENYYIVYDEDKGYVWMQRAVRFMDNFYADRKQYPYIKDFLPQLAKFMDFTADNIKTILKEYENEHPYVVNVYPALNSVVDAASIDTIRIEFSHPIRSYSLPPSGIEGLKRPEYDFLSVITSYNEKILSIPVKLKENTSYGLKVGIQSAKGYEMDGKFELKFKTK